MTKIQFLRIELAKELVKSVAMQFSSTFPLFEKAISDDEGNFALAFRGWDGVTSNKFNCYFPCHLHNEICMKAIVMRDIAQLFVQAKLEET